MGASLLNNHPELVPLTLSGQTKNDDPRPAGPIIRASGHDKFFKEQKIRRSRIARFIFRPYFFKSRAEIKL